MSSEEVCEKLVKEVGVLTLPGGWFMPSKGSREWEVLEKQGSEILEDRWIRWVAEFGFLSLIAIAIARQLFALLIDDGDIFFYGFVCACHSWEKNEQIRHCQCGRFSRDATQRPFTRFP